MRMWKTKLLTFALALVSTIALGQTATTFIYTKNVGTRTNAIAPLLLDSSTTALRWRESDATADNKQWEWVANAEQFRLGALTDAGVLGGSAILIDRTGNVIDSISLQGILFSTGSRFELESTAPLIQGDETDAPANERSWLWRQTAGDWFLSTATDAAPQSAVLNPIAIVRNGTGVDSFTINSTAGSFIVGSGVVSSLTVTAPAFNSGSTQPNYRWIESDASANETIWDSTTNGGDISFRTRTDVDGAGVTWLTASRTGTTIDSLALTSTALTWNTNTLFTTANDGSGSGLDADLLDGNSSAAFAILSASNTFTNSINQFVNTGGPRIVLRDSDAGADTQCFFMLSQSGQFDLYASTDTNCTTTSGAESAFQVLKSGAAISDVRFPNGTVRFSTTDSPAFSTSTTNVTSEVSTTDVVAAAQVSGNDAPSSAMSLTRATTSNASPTLFSNKARGNLGAFSIVVADDNLFRLLGSGWDGVTWSNAGEITIASDGTPGSGDMPGRLVFSTTADGANVPTERLRINSVGAWGLAGANFGTAAQVLTSNGSGSAPTWQNAAAGGTPGGATTQVQYNNAGAFAGDAGMTYVAGTDTLSVGTVTAATAITVAGNNVCQSTGTNCPAGSAGTLTNRNYSTSDNTVAGDCGKVIRFTGGASQTFTLDADPPVNCVLTFVNDGSASTSVAASTTLQWFNGSGTISTGTRTIAVGGVLSATVFTTQGTWQIWGSGVQ